MGFKKRFLTLLIISLTAAASYGQSWFNLGYGSHALKANDRIATICTDTFNNVYAAGYFTDSTNSFMGPEGYQYVAKWDVFTYNWSELGTGSNRLKANQSINSICTDKKGNVYAAGSFTDGVSMGLGYWYVAKWDGIKWAPLGVGSNALKANGIIQTICADDCGNIYAAGNFYNTAGYLYVAKWDGIKWREVGNLLANSFITSLCTDDSFNVYAGGNFTDASGHVYVAKWDHATNNWNKLDTGFSGQEVSSICVDSSKNVYASVNYYSSSIGLYSDIFKWDGTQFHQLGALNCNSLCNTICLGDSGKVYAGGDFKNSMGYRYVAKYDPYTDIWSELGSLNPHSFIAPAYPVIMALCTDKKHNIYVSGIFTDDDNHCYVAEYGISNLGVTEITTSDFTVYPNPIENEINIKTSKVESYEYTLFDGMGRLYKTGIL